MKDWSVVVLGMMLLSGCAQDYNQVCPPLVTYSPNFKQILAQEITQLPQQSLIPSLIEDYINLRSLCRNLEP